MSKRKDKNQKKLNNIPYGVENRNLTLRRTAKEAKKSSIIVKALALTTVLLVMIVAITYAISYFYDRLGSFTIKLNKYDMAKQGITLSEKRDITNPTSRLNADIIKDMYNISGKDLPADLNDHDGSHNGDNYIAYTFYLANSGVDTVTIQYAINMSNISKNIDAAIRVRLYEDGKFIDWAKAKPNGNPEADTTKFPGAYVAARGLIDTFSPGDIKKYTVVIWLEGNDPDCINDIIGGAIKLEMDFSIIEGS